MELTRRDVLRAGIGGILLANAAKGRILRGAATPPSRGNNVGVNPAGIFYAGPTTPFLNVLKGCGSNYYNGWTTATSTNGDTNESGLIQLNSDGYPTSLSGGTFTFVTTACCTRINTQYGASGPYPTGNYTFQCTGSGTYYLGGDASAPVRGTDSNSTTYLTVSSQTVSGVTATMVTSTAPAGTVTTSTWTVAASNSGINLNIMATTAGNPLLAMSLVQTTYQSSYLAGSLFHPTYKAQLANGTAGYSRLRFMPWQETNAQDCRIDFTGSVSGTSGGIIASLTNAWGSSPVAYWPFATGTYYWHFATGQVIAVSCTYKSASVTWSTALSSALATQTYGQAYFTLTNQWSERPLLSNIFWGVGAPGMIGVPLEAQAQLCNELGIDGWFNIPCGAMPVSQALTPSQTYAKSMAQLLYDGTGANLAGSYVSSFTGLGSSQRAFIEFTNEYWNGVFAQFTYCTMGGVILSGGNTGYWPMWYGSMVSYIGDAFYAVYGAALTTRCCVLLGMQTGGSYQAGQAMTTTYTADSQAAWKHHIQGINTGGYFGLDKLSSADAAVLFALPLNGTTSQVEAYFTLMNSLVYNTYTYSSLGFAGSTAGMIGSTAAQAAADYTGSATGQVWGTLPLYVYEGGTASSDYVGETTAAWNALLDAAAKDSRSALVYYDPNHTLPASTGGFLPAMKAAGVTSVNLFVDVEQAGYDNSDWNVLYSQLQTISPLSSAPPKYQGVMNYVAA